MKSWKAWLLVAVIFCTGALAGAFGMRAYMARNLPELLADTRKRFEEHFLEVLDREVGLSEAQKQTLLPILKEAVGKADAIHAKVGAEMEAARKETDDRIAKELDTAQRVKFAEFRARMDKMFRERPDHRGPPPPGFALPPGGMPGPPPPLPGDAPPPHQQRSGQPDAAQPGSQPK